MRNQQEPRRVLHAHDGPGRRRPRRISPDRATRITALAEMKLKIADKIDRVDQEYFKEQIEPLVAQPHVQFVGEITEAEKSEFLGNAAGLVFPILGARRSDWQ